MKADYDRAATAAMQILIDHSITETPINPLPILLSYEGGNQYICSTGQTDKQIDQKMNDCTICANGRKCIRIRKLSDDQKVGRIKELLQHTAGS